MSRPKNTLFLARRPPKNFFWGVRLAKKSVFFGPLAAEGRPNPPESTFPRPAPMTPFVNANGRVRSKQSWFFSDVQPEIYPTTRSPPHAGRRMSREHSPIFEHVGYHLFLFGFGAVL